MKKSIYYWLGALLLSTPLFFSCVNDLAEDTGQLVEPAVDHLATIRALGFSLDGLVETEDSYLVEGDISISKAELEFYAGSAALRQARTEYLISLENRFRITVKMESTVPDVWQTAIREALNAWSSSGRMKFTVVSSGNADITFKTGKIAPFGYPEPLAAGSFPLSNGKPGNLITISNDYKDYGFTHKQRVYLMVHELGHNIGFRHTNWQGDGESTAISIPGTPTGNNPDSGSVMNSGSWPVPEWRDFSAYDKTALATIYPERNPYNFSNESRRSIGAGTSVSVDFVCLEEIEATVVINYFNPIYSLLNPQKIIFRGSCGGVSYSGGPTKTVEQTVRFRKGVNGATLVIDQTNYNQEEGVISANLLITNMKSVATGQTVGTGSTSISLSWTVISKDTSGQI